MPHKYPKGRKLNTVPVHTVHAPAKNKAHDMGKEADSRKDFEDTDRYAK